MFVSAQADPGMLRDDRDIVKAMKADRDKRDHIKLQDLDALPLTALEQAYQQNLERKRQRHDAIVEDHLHLIDRN